MSCRKTYRMSLFGVNVAGRIKKRSKNKSSHKTLTFLFIHFQQRYSLRTQIEQDFSSEGQHQGRARESFRRGRVGRRVGRSPDGHGGARRAGAGALRLHRRGEWWAQLQTRWGNSTSIRTALRGTREPLLRGEWDLSRVGSRGWQIFVSYVQFLLKR